MRLALIGVGQAGGKIVDRFIEYDDAHDAGFLTGVTAINTAQADLFGLDTVPQEHRVLIGQEHTKGHGVGADNELGADIAVENRSSILGAIDDFPISRTDAFIVVAALGGGTGSGAAPVIARTLREIYSEPVYGLGILPARDEGGIYALNAARSFRTFVRDTDNLLLFDNDAWRKPGESIESGYEEINEEIVRRFGVLFSAGEIDRAEGIAESVVDSSEIINTLACGGITTVGYAHERLDQTNQGLLSRFRDGDPTDTDATSRITTLVREATRGRLTMPCGVGSADRALILAAGPSDSISRRGIERGREWLEREADVMEIRSGDYPIPGAGGVSVGVMLAGVTEVPRIDGLQEAAVDTQDRFEDRDASRDGELADLVTDERDELDPVY